jgi:hypothetical protein
MEAALGPKLPTLWPRAQTPRLSSASKVLTPQPPGISLSPCCALSTPAQQCERQHRVRNRVRPRPPLHRSGRDLLRSRLVASQDSRTRPVGRTRRCTRSTGAAGSTGSRAGGTRASPTPSSAVADSFRLGHAARFSFDLADRVDEVCHDRIRRTALRLANHLRRAEETTSSLTQPVSEQVRDTPIQPAMSAWNYDELERTRVYSERCMRSRKTNGKTAAS